MQHLFLALAATETCDPDAQVCETTLDLTGNDNLAKVSDVLIGKPLMILAIILGAYVLRWILHRVIDRIVRKAERGVLPNRVSGMSVGGTSVAQALSLDHEGSDRRIQRAATMGTLLKSVVTGVVFAIAFTMVLSEVGVNIAPLIASAGVVGVALGFGAQSLVKDFLSGIFMIFEDQYGVGDVVDLGEAIGTVEAVSLRVTRLRDVNGTVWYVRNGEILRVGNQSQNWARSVLDISVGYKEDLARVRRVLQEVAHDVWEDDEFKGVVIEEPEVWGVEALMPESVTIRVTLKTAPMEQWRVAREMRQRIKARFDYEGIEIPLPQRVVWRHDVHSDQPGVPMPEGEPKA